MVNIDPHWRQFLQKTGLLKTKKVVKVVSLVPKTPQNLNDNGYHSFDPTLPFSTTCRISCVVLQYHAQKFTNTDLRWPWRAPLVRHVLREIKISHVRKIRNDEISREIYSRKFRIIQYRSSSLAVCGNLCGHPVQTYSATSIGPVEGAISVLVWEEHHRKDTSRSGTRRITDISSSVWRLHYKNGLVLVKNATWIKSEMPLDWSRFPIRSKWFSIKSQTDMDYI